MPPGLIHDPSFNPGCKVAEHLRHTCAGMHNMSGCKLNIPPIDMQSIQQTARYEIGIRTHEAEESFSQSGKKLLNFAESH